MPYVCLFLYYKKKDKQNSGTQKKTLYFFNFAGSRARTKQVLRTRRLCACCGRKFWQPSVATNQSTKRTFQGGDDDPMGKTFGNHGGLFFTCYILLKSHWYTLMLWILSWFIDVYRCWHFLYNKFPNKIIHRDQAEAAVHWNMAHGQLKLLVFRGIPGVCGRPAQC